MNDKKIVVSGSSGTIGTRLCERLIGEGYEVVGLDLKPNEWSDLVNSKTVVSDMREKKFFDKLPKDVWLFIHLAANARVYNLVLEPELALDNVKTTFNALEFCRQRKVQRFIFASSREIYGNSKKGKRSENQVSIDDCESPYSASKIAGEALVRSYKKCYEVDFIITRFSNVYGMYDKSDRLVPTFIRNCNSGKNLVIYGKDKALDFTYIDDAVDGVLKCVENFERAKNSVYNISSGREVKLSKVADLVQREFGFKVPIIFKDNRKGEVVKFSADVSKANKVLGFKPKVMIEEGIKRAVQWYLDYVAEKQ
jgi:UDP-glucose 4-epimerase